MFSEDYGNLLIHRRMLADRVRCEAYRRAILATVKPGQVVLDVGAGTGILSLFAAEAGARKVYAVERTPTAAVARQIVARNRLADRVSVLQTDIENAELPERVDVIVSEWMGSYGVEENLLPAVLQARDRWLKPDGRLLPERVTAWMAPVADPHLDQSLGLWRGQPYGLDLGVIADRQVHEPIFADHPLGPDALLAEPQGLWAIDAYRHCAAEARLPFRSAVCFTAARSGHVSSLAAWFDSEIASGVTLTNAPGAPKTHWRLALFPLERPTLVRPGTPIQVRFCCAPAGVGHCRNTWSVRVGNGPWEHHATPSAARSAEEHEDGAFPFAYTGEHFVDLCV